MGGWEPRHCSRDTSALPPRLGAFKARGWAAGGACRGEWGPPKGVRGMGLGARRSHRRRRGRWLHQWGGACW